MEACWWSFSLSVTTQRREQRLRAEIRLGTSVMAGSPVPRVEDSGVVEWMDGDVIWLR